MPALEGSLVTPTLRSPRHFILGIIALAGAVVTGILLFTVVPGATVVPTLPQIPVLIVGAALLFGGTALLARSIHAPAAVVLGVGLVGVAVVIGVVASAVPLCGTSGTGLSCYPAVVSGIVLFLGGISMLVVGFRGGAEVGALYRLPVTMAGGLLLIAGLLLVGVSLSGGPGGAVSSVGFILAWVGVVLLVVPFAVRNGRTTVSS